MCKSPPAEISVLGFAPHSTRGEELISPFDLHSVLLGLFAQTTLSHPLAAHGVPCPGLECLPLAGAMGQCHVARVSSPPQPKFDHLVNIWK